MFHLITRKVSHFMISCMGMSFKTIEKGVYNTRRNYFHRLLWPSTMMLPLLLLIVSTASVRGRVFDVDLIVLSVRSTLTPCDGCETVKHPK